MIDTDIVHPESEIPSVDELIESDLRKSRVYDAVIHGSLREASLKARLDPDDWFIAARRDELRRKLLDFASTPEKVELLTHLSELGVDCAHGSTNLNLESILRHGIVPAETLRALGLYAFGKENYTLPYKRNGIHVVPVSDIGETARYADQKVDPKNSEFVNLANYQAALKTDKNRYLGLDADNMSFGSYLINNRKEAEMIEAYVAVGRMAKVEFPVVFGIASGELSPETKFLALPGGSIQNDIGVSNHVPRDAIKTIFVPAEHVEEVRAIADGIEVIDIKRIR